MTSICQADLRLERFTEALEDSASQLTYPALTGQRKQSVRDAERLLRDAEWSSL